MLVVRRLLLRHKKKIATVYIILLLQYAVSLSFSPSSSSSARSSSSPTQTQHFSTSGQPEQQQQLRLVSWNLLAPMYASPPKFPRSDPLHLDWPSHRKPLIVRTLLKSEADIICLQEVQTDLWPDLLHSLAGQYHGILQNVTRGHAVANAVLIKKKPLQNKKKNHSTTTGSIATTADGINVNNDLDLVAEVLEVESRSRALIVVLRANYHHNHNHNVRCEIGANTADDDQKDFSATAKTPLLPSQSPPPPLLFLANLHLEAGYGKKHDQTRYYQLQSLLKRLHKHAVLYQEQGAVAATSDNNSCQRTCTKEKQAIVLTGDFNIRTDNPLYHLLSTAMFPGPEQYKNSNNNNALAPNALEDGVPCIPVDCESLEYGPWMSEFHKKAKNIKQVQNLPLLPLQDAYRACPPVAGPLHMTYRGADVLDFLWTSAESSPSSADQQDNDVGSTKNVNLPSFQVVETLRIDPAASYSTPQNWPDQDHPSDHLPIGAVLQFNI